MGSREIAESRTKAQRREIQIVDALRFSVWLTVDERLKLKRELRELRSTKHPPG